MGALIAWMIAQVVRARYRTWDDLYPTIIFTTIVTTLTAGRIGTPDQVLLLIPWVEWMGGRNAVRFQTAARVAALVLIALPWVVFIATLRGATEDPIVTIILPLVTVVGYIYFNKRNEK
jgi:hypothetical protein